MESYKFSGEISKLAQKFRFEIDESYFGSKRVRGLVLSYDLCCYCILKGYEFSEVEFRYNTETTQENLYQKLLKLIRGLIGSNASRS